MQSRIIVVKAFVLSSTILGLAAVFAAAQAPAVPPKSKTPDPPSTPAIIAQGKAVYASLDCNTCHTISNAGTQVGPDLTLVGKTFTAQRLKTMIRHPRQIAPKGFMPAYSNKKISSAQLSTLAAYLASLK